MLKKYLFLGITVASSIFQSNSVFSACPPSICSEEALDISAIMQQIEENKSKLAEAKDSAANSMLSNMFAYKEELPGKECLDGLQGLQISPSFVDITTGFPNLLAALMDQIVNAGCAAVVDAANDEIESANNSINDFGSKMSEATSGLISLDSSTNRSGSFELDVEVKSIQDMPQVKAETERWNDKVEKRIYGEGGYQGPGNAPSDIDLTDDRYYKNNSDLEGSHDVIDYDAAQAGQEQVDNAACWLTEDC